MGNHPDAGNVPLADIGVVSVKPVRGIKKPKLAVFEDSYVSEIPIWLMSQI